MKKITLLFCVLMISTLAFSQCDTVTHRGQLQIKGCPSLNPLIVTNLKPIRPDVDPSEWSYIGVNEVTGIIYKVPDPGESMNLTYQFTRNVELPAMHPGMAYVTTIEAPAVAPGSFVAVTTPYDPPRCPMIPLLLTGTTTEQGEIVMVVYNLSQKRLPKSKKNYYFYVTQPSQK